jgi:hypothetical protein
MTKKECSCSMRIKLVGDGCEICNPERAEDLMTDEHEATEAKGTDYELDELERDSPYSAYLSYKVWLYS